MASNKTEPVVTAIHPDMCTKCGYLNTHATGIPGNERVAPVEDGLAICFNCGLVTVFTADLKKRPLGDRELRELPAVTRRQIKQAQSRCMLRRGIDLSKRDGSTT